jgi:hypothetical protein
MQITTETAYFQQIFAAELSVEKSQHFNFFFSFQHFQVVKKYWHKIAVTEKK